MAKVLEERKVDICAQCVLFHCNGDLPHDLPESEIEDYVGNLALCRWTWSIPAQWSDDYNEFSVSTCGSCGDTRGGERYFCTVELFDD